MQDRWRGPSAADRPGDKPRDPRSHAVATMKKTSPMRRRQPLRLLRDVRRSCDDDGAGFAGGERRRRRGGRSLASSELGSAACPCARRPSVRSARQLSRSARPSRPGSRTGGPAPRSRASGRARRTGPGRSPNGYGLERVPGNIRADDVEHVPSRRHANVADFRLPPSRRASPFSGSAVGEHDAVRRRQGGWRERARSRGRGSGRRRRGRRRRAR